MSDGRPGEEDSHLSTQSLRLSISSPLSVPSVVDAALCLIDMIPLDMFQLDDGLFKMVVQGGGGGGTDPGVCCPTGVQLPSLPAGFWEESRQRALSDSRGVGTDPFPAAVTGPVLWPQVCFWRKGDQCGPVYL